MAHHFRVEIDRWICYTYMYGETHLVSMHCKEDDKGLNLGFFIDTKAQKLSYLCGRFEDTKILKNR